MKLFYKENDMERDERPITKEQYDRAMLNHGYIDEVDMPDIFSVAEICGYGVYSPVAHKKYNEETKTDEYYVGYMLGSTCD